METSLFPREAVISVVERDSRQSENSGKTSLETSIYVSFLCSGLKIDLALPLRLTLPLPMRLSSYRVKTPFSARVGVLNYHLLEGEEYHSEISRIISGSFPMEVICSGPPCSVALGLFGHEVTKLCP